MSSCVAAPPTPATALPELREATRPPEARGLARDGVRLLVATRDHLRHARFRDLPELLAPGDLLVVNTSATLPAALPARRANGTELMLHLSSPVPREASDRWVVELRLDGARAAGIRGERLALPGGAGAELLAPYLGRRLWVAELTLPDELLAYLDRHGEPIRYRHARGDWPLAEYQTIFAREPGSAEMPSAGRPFTAELLDRLVASGIGIAQLVLHTGVSSLEDGETPYPERFRVPGWTAERANAARRLGGRVIAVGTTVVRALESAASADGSVSAGGGWTDLVLDPGSDVRAVDGVLTGFHDSDSSHLRLLAAIAGPGLVERSQRAAAGAGYLRHEFGDLNLLLPG